MLKSGKGLKRIFAVVLVLCLTFGFAGCSEKAQEPAKEQSGQSQQSQQSNDAEPEKKAIEIELVHSVSAQQDFIQKMVDEYYKQTGVKIVTNIIDSKASAQYQMTWAQEKKFPDIYISSLAGEPLANIVNAGIVVDLTPAWEEWGYDRIGKAKSYKGYLEEGNKWGAASGRYSIPYAVATSGYWYNVELLKSVGVDKLPETWEEFITLCEKLKESKVIPIAFNFGDQTGAVSMVCFPFATNVFGGEEAFYKVMESKDAFKDPRWVIVFNAISELKTKGYFDDGTVVLAMKDVEQKFINKEVAIISNGSWFVPAIQKNGPDIKWAVAAPPALIRDNPVNIDGGVSYSFTLGNNKNSAEALEFVKWFTDTPQQKAILEDIGILPANEAGMEGASIDENLKPFITLGSSLTRLRAHELAANAGIYEELWKGIQSLVEGKTTSQQLADDLQKVLESKNQ